MKHNDHTIISVIDCQKLSPDYCDNDQSVHRGSDGAILCSDIIEECRKQKFDDASQWLPEDWISKLAKGGGAKERFQYCVNPNSSNQFLYLPAIQGHTGNNVVDPALHDNVLFPKGFTEYIYHVGNAMNNPQEMTDFFVHDYCFLREPVGVPNPVGDDRKE